MKLASLAMALLLAHLRPLRPGWVGALGARLEQVMADGHAMLPDAPMLRWWVVVAGGAGLALICHGLANAVHPLLGFVFGLLVLYAVLDFRRHSESLADVHLRLAAGEVEGARATLGEWVGRDVGYASAGEIARLSIETALVQAHRTVLGVIFWWVVLPGPTGVVGYVLARELARGAEQRHDDEDEAVREPQDARALYLRAFGWVDWLPVRLTAVSFSILGNFEDAIYCWRSQSVLWADKGSGILVASGAGALGVRLGLPIHSTAGVIDRPEMGTGHKADTQHMQGAARLVWRVLLLWLLLLILFGLAGLMGR